MARAGETPELRVPPETGIAAAIHEELKLERFGVESKAAFHDNGRG